MEKGLRVVIDKIIVYRIDSALFIIIEAEVINNPLALDYWPVWQPFNLRYLDTFTHELSTL